jgi:hypothetical protein
LTKWRELAPDRILKATIFKTKVLFMKQNRFYGIKNKRPFYRQLWRWTARGYQMTAALFLFDFWVGVFWDHAKRRLFICPLPCVVLEFGKVPAPAIVKTSKIRLQMSPNAKKIAERLFAGMSRPMVKEAIDAAAAEMNERIRKQIFNGSNAVWIGTDPATGEDVGIEHVNANGDRSIIAEHHGFTFNPGPVPAEAIEDAGFCLFDPRDFLQIADPARPYTAVYCCAHCGVEIPGEHLPLCKKARPLANNAAGGDNKKP